MNILAKLGFRRQLSVECVDKIGLSMEHMAWSVRVEYIKTVLHTLASMRVMVWAEVE